MKKNFLFFLIWVVSVTISILYTYEHPETIDYIKNKIKNVKNPEFIEKEDYLISVGNSFILEFSKEISTEKKTSFVLYDEKKKDFKKDILEIYFQNGYLFKNGKLEKLNLPENFTEDRNGGLKSIFIYKKNKFGLISSLEGDCYYASLVYLSNAKEIFKTACLDNKKIDFNGLGSSHIHLNDKILLSIGTPEQASPIIRKLAQDKESMFGKIIEINKIDLDKVIKNEKINIDVKIFSLGHRNPQGLTKINNSVFSVEHGPKGGDELNKIIKDKNYGWPLVSYGTKYCYEERCKSYEINHEKNNFEEPLFALVPSVGISGLSRCPTKLNNYYKKPCLLALSLYGNNLRRGRSIIIYLLNEKMTKVHSIEKIHLRDNLKLRHFVTNSKNELYEDIDGSIYFAADKQGIYKLDFINFRN